MSRVKKNPLWSLEDLIRQHSSGKPHPPIPTHITMSAIKVREEVFQHRNIPAFMSDSHIRDLATTAKDRDLAAILVWWDGKKWTLIDGHHRMKAYAFANKRSHAVPVEVFQGTPHEAVAKALESNSQPKLQMTPSEKTHAAWRLVVMAVNLSKAELSRASLVSESIIASMRAVKRTLLTKYNKTESDLAEMPWHQARNTAKGNDNEWSPEEEDKRVAVMAAALRKVLGPTAERQPDIFIKALEMYSPQLWKLLESAVAEPPEDVSDEDA